MSNPISKFLNKRREEELALKENEMLEFLKRTGIPLQQAQAQVKKWREQYGNN